MPSIPETWLDEFIVSLPSAGYSNDPDIIQLANGNILVGWTTNVDTGAGNALGLDMVGQIFDPLGNRVGDEITLNQAYFIDNEVDVDMAAQADGGFLVAYSDAGPSGTSIRLERHAADGSIITNATIQEDNTTTAPNYQNAHVAVSGATSALVIYQVSGGLSSSDADIVGRIYDPSTGMVGPEIALIGYGSDTITSGDVTALSNGNYVIVAQRDVRGDTEIITRIIDPTGENVAGVAPIAMTDQNGAGDYDPSVTALTNGGFVVTWTNTDAADTDIGYAVFTAGGVQMTTAYVPGAGSTDSNNEQVVAGLADGSFVIAYDDDTNGLLKVAHFDETGVFLGDFVVSASAPTQISITDLKDGRFAIAWLQETGGIVTEILDTRDAVNDGVYTPKGWQIGTVGDDVFTADSTSEFVHGHSGDGTMTEAGQVREYYGGAGNDVINATSTLDADIHDGGTGIDTIDWSGANLGNGTRFNLDMGTATNARSGVEAMVNFENLNGTTGTDVIFGSKTDNILTGNAGNDRIFGDAGNDYLAGGTGDDLISGGVGDDMMFGGAGDDSYVVNSIGDQVFETATATGKIDEGGTDTVSSSITFSLNATTGVRYIENLTLNGTRNIDGFGNARDNRLIGNAGNNVLDAGAGGDTMLGGAGNDTYYVDSRGDRVFETTTMTNNIDAGGIDTVHTSVSFNLDATFGTRFVEHLMLTGTDNIKASGNALDNRLTGNAGNNILNAGLGSDLMTGGAGKDSFVFNTALSAANVDRIADFNLIDDTIRLDHSIFAGLATGRLDASAFTANQSGFATDALDRIIYETDTGRLYFDADGNGAGARVLFAILSANLLLTPNDFFVF